MPRAGARGERSGRTAWCRGASSFNEAACRSTRRERNKTPIVTRVRRLQRGCVPEHAERRFVAQRATLLEELQRGRVPEHAESHAENKQYGAGDYASTRPRAGARGEVAHQPARRGQPGASTRPRAGARGEVAAGRRSGKTERGLQRGRVPEHAESEGRRHDPKGLPRASTRPRAGARGESSHSTRTVSAPNCFNEAACRSTRRAGLKVLRVERQR